MPAAIGDRHGPGNGKALRDGPAPHERVDLPNVRQDIEITKIDRRFVTGYEFYLKTVRRCNRNSTMKYLKNFRRIINLALADKYITDDPFTGIKLAVHEVERAFLEEHELEALQAHLFPMERLSHIRDIFLFCCYTGLAFSDVQGLKQTHICTDNDGAQ